ncbi:repetitive organellar protein [Helicoverpa armigera]|uniref:repetitive organellar protein n=1 Tax=Helicoverpa armigera TaxID=29058 RepID=UPI003082BF76
MDLALFILILQIGFNSALNYRHSNRMAVIPSSRLFNIELSRRSAPYNRNLQRTSRSYSGSDSEETDFDYTSYEEPISFTSFKLYKRRKNPTQVTKAHNEAKFEQSASKLHSDNHAGPLDKKGTDFRRPYILHGTQNRRLGPTSIHDIKDLEDVVHRRAANYLKLLFTIIEEQNSRRNLNDDRKVPINSPATSSANFLGSRFVETANRRRSNHEVGNRYRTDSRNNQPLPLKRAGSFDAAPPMPVSRSQLRIPDPLKPSKHETARRRDDDYNNDVDYNNEENDGNEDEDGNNDDNDNHDHRHIGGEYNNANKVYDYHHVEDEYNNDDKEYDHHHVEDDHNNDENEYNHHHVEDEYNNANKVYDYHHVEDDHNNDDKEYDHHHVEDDHNNDENEYNHHHVEDEYNNANKVYDYHHVEDDHNNDDKEYDHHHVEDDHNDDENEYNHHHVEDEYNNANKVYDYHHVEDDHNNDDKEYDHHHVEDDHNNDENEYNHHHVEDEYNNANKVYDYHHVEDEYNNDDKEYDHHHVEDEYNNDENEYNHHHVEDDHNNDENEYEHHHVEDEYNNAHKVYEYHHVEDDHNNDDKEYDHHHVEDEYNNANKVYDYHHVEDDHNNDDKEYDHHHVEDEYNNANKVYEYHHVEDDHNNDDKEYDHHHVEDDHNNDEEDGDNHDAEDDDNNDAQDDDTNDEKDGDYYNVEDDGNNDEKDDDNHDAQDDDNHVAGDDDNHDVQDDDNNDKEKDDNDDEIKDHNDKEYDDDHDAKDNDNLDTEGDDYDFEFESDDSCESEDELTPDDDVIRHYFKAYIKPLIDFALATYDDAKNKAIASPTAKALLDKLKVLPNIDQEDKNDTKEVKSLRLSDLVDIKSRSISHNGKLGKSKEYKKNTGELLVSPIHRSSDLSEKLGDLKVIPINLRIEIPFNNKIREEQHESHKKSLDPQTILTNFEQTLLKNHTSETLGQQKPHNELRSGECPEQSRTKHKNTDDGSSATDSSSNNTEDDSDSDKSLEDDNDRDQENSIDIPINKDHDNKTDIFNKPEPLKTAEDVNETNSILNLEFPLNDILSSSDDNNTSSEVDMEDFLRNHDSRYKPEYSDLMARSPSDDNNNTSTEVDMEEFLRGHDSKHKPEYSDLMTLSPSDDNDNTSSEVDMELTPDDDVIRHYFEALIKPLIELVLATYDDANNKDIASPTVKGLLGKLKVLTNIDEEDKDDTNEVKSLRLSDLVDIKSPLISHDGKHSKSKEDKKNTVRLLISPTETLGDLKVIPINLRVEIPFNNKVREEQHESHKKRLNLQTLLTSMLTNFDVNERNSMLNLEVPWNDILSSSDDNNNTSSEVDMEEFLRGHDSKQKPEYSDLMTLSPSDNNNNTSSEVDMELTPDDDVIRHYFEALIKPLIDLVLATYDDANNKDIASPTVKALLDKLKVLTNIDEEEKDDTNEEKSLRLSDLVDIKSPLIGHGGKHSKSKEDKKNTVRLLISPIHRSSDLTETLGDLKVIPINLRVEIPFNNKVREEQHESHNKRLDSQTMLTSMLTNFGGNERNSILNLEFPWNDILSPSDDNNNTLSEVDMEDFLRNHDSKHKPEYLNLEYPWASVFTDETAIRKDEDQTLDLEYLWKNVISTEDNKSSKQITDSLQLEVPHLDDTVYNQLRGHKKHTGKVYTNKRKQQPAKSKASPDEGKSTEKISSHSSDPLYEHPLLRQHKQNDQRAFHDTRDNYLRQFGSKLNLRHYSNNNEYDPAQNYLRDVPNEPDVSDEDGEGRAFIMVPLDRRPLTRLRTQEDLPYILNVLGPQLRRSTYNDTIIFPSD